MPIVRGGFGKGVTGDAPPNPSQRDQMEVGIRGRLGVLKILKVFKFIFVMEVSDEKSPVLIFSIH